MKLQLCLIALLWSMQSTMHAADEATSSEDPHRRAEAGSNEAQIVIESVDTVPELAVDGGVLEGSGRSSNVSEDSQHQLLALQKYPAFNLRAPNTDGSERNPLSYAEQDPAFGGTRTVSGHTLESEGGSSVVSPLTEGVDFPPAAVSDQ